MFGIREKRTAPGEILVNVKISPQAAVHGRFPFRATGGNSGSPHSAFDDLASRHPMFAQHVRRGAPWEDPFGPDMDFPRGSGIPRDRHNSGGASSASATASSGTGNGGEHVIPIHVVKSDGTSTPAEAHQQQQQSDKQTEADKAGKKPQQAYNTQRNTTEIPIQSVKQTVRDLEDSLRSTRAQSAPPSSFASPPVDGNPRFVTKMSIDPQLPKPPTAQSTPPVQPPNMTEVGGNSSKNNGPTNLGSGNIRTIPIFVEGRQANGQSHNVPDSRSREASPRPPAPNQGPAQPPASDPEEHSPPKKPTLPKDPLEVIQLIVQDVQALVTEVEKYSGTSRTAKDYLYLDEMLTRNLIKLDVIETEGREDVRQARRDCIKLIQGTISKLEAKVPLPGGTSEQKTEEMEVGTTGSPSNAVATLAVDSTATNLSNNEQGSVVDPASCNEQPASTNAESPMEVTSGVAEESASSQQ